MLQAEGYNANAPVFHSRMRFRAGMVRDARLMVALPQPRRPAKGANNGTTEMSFSAALKRSDAMRA